MATPQTHCHRSAALVETSVEERVVTGKRPPRRQRGKETVRTLALPRPQDQPGHYREIGGSASDKWNQLVGGQIAAALPARQGDNNRQRNDRHEAGIMALVGIGPGDELEAMAAAQLIAVHSAAMESFRQAAIPGQHSEARNVTLCEAVRLTRGFACLLDALGRYRVVALRRQAAQPQDRTRRRAPAVKVASAEEPGISPSGIRAPAGPARGHG